MKFSTLVLAACILVVVPLSAWPSGRQAPEVISARRIEIKDANGKVRMVLGVDDKGESSIRMMNSKGAKRAEIAVNEEGDPSFSFLDEGGMPLVQFGVDSKERSTSFYLAEKGPHASIQMTVANGRFVSVYRAKEGRAVLEMMEGKPTFFLQKGSKVKKLTP
jgi:hypothetical protein